MDKRNVTVSLMPMEDAPEEVRHFFSLSPDSVCKTNGKIFLSTGRNVLSCEDSPEGNELISALMQKYRPDSCGFGSASDPWHQIITATDKGSIAPLIRKNGIDELKKRTVIVFRMKYLLEQNLYSIFNDTAPMEENDHLIPLGYDTTALVKDTSFRSEEEIAEYTAAVIDTMVSEGYTDLQAGIGTEAESVYELHRSYDEAWSALMTGAKFHGNKNLFRYSEQKLERIINLIPREERKKILEDFYSGGGSEAFSDEMMETVRVFFEHDLNITSASKELFIHRNTLNYRLDKIKRDTGLDLRTFQDAIIFRLISEMTEEM
jgi:sugar diacid utilization regulator